MARGTGGTAEEEDLPTCTRSSGSGSRSRTSKLRPLGIPTITDRVVQTAAMLVLGAHLRGGSAPEQYAYRAERGAQDAVKAVHGLLKPDTASD